MERRIILEPFRSTLMVIMAPSFLMVMLVSLYGIQASFVKEMIDQNINGMMSIDYEATEQENSTDSTTLTTKTDEQININDSNSTKADPWTIPLSLDISYLAGNQSGPNVIQVNCRSPTSTKVIHYTINNNPPAFMEKTVCDFQVRELLLAAIVVAVLLLFLICILLCCLMSKKETEVIPLAITSRPINQ